MDDYNRIYRGSFLGHPNQAGGRWSCLVWRVLPLHTRIKAHFKAAKKVEMLQQQEKNCFTRTAGNFRFKLLSRSYLYLGLPKLGLSHCFIGIAYLTAELSVVHPHMKSSWLGHFLEFFSSSFLKYYVHELPLSPVDHLPAGSGRQASSKLWVITWPAWLLSSLFASGLKFVLRPDLNSEPRLFDIKKMLLNTHMQSTCVYIAGELA